MTRYDVHAVRFATSTSTRRQVYVNFDWHGAPDETFQGEFYFWVITGGDRVMLLDTGFTEPVARSHRFTLLASVQEGLHALGLSPGDVDSIFMSHLHFDHTGSLELFPNAEIVVQGAEIDFWSSAMARRTLFAATAEWPYLEQLARADSEGRVRRIHGDTTVAEGIETLALPGHTVGQQGLRVQTAERRIILAGDSVHFFDELRNDWPFLAFDSLSAMYATYDRLRALEAGGDVLVPGHATETIKQFASREFGSGGLVVNLR